MIKQQIFSIVFSALLLPSDFCCAFWLFREAINLCGMTFGEAVRILNAEMLNTGIRKNRLIRVQRALAAFFHKNSTDHDKSIRLTKAFGFCTLMGLAALALALFAATVPTAFKYTVIGNIILTVLNIALAVFGLIYGKKHPLSRELSEKLSVKRSRGKAKRRNAFIYAFVAVLFFGVLLFILLGIASAFRTEPCEVSRPSAIAVQSELINELGERGYETANVPTTYWEFDENKLEHIAAGVKGDSRFEFYGYSDNETVESVYERIIHSTAPEFDKSECEKHETRLSNDSEMFTAVIDGVYYLIMYRNDTVVYAYSPDSLSEINGILTEIGYFKDR